MHFIGDSSFSLEELYFLCVRFIKEKEGKAFHLSYQDRLQLAAHCKQVAHGPYKADASPGVGWLDVVGSDRKATWQALGDLSRERAQEKFVEILDRACPLLAPYLEAHLNEKRAREQKLKEEAEEKLREAERQKQLELELQKQQQLQKQAEEMAAAEAKLKSASNASGNSPASPTGGPAPANNSRDDSRRHQQEAQIRAALNQQTAVQFRQYAAEQHPTDAGKQAELIAQLQEQHYQQYISQVYQQQLRHQEEQAKQQQQQQQNHQTQQQIHGADLSNSLTDERAASNESAAEALTGAAAANIAGSNGSLASTGPAIGSSSTLMAAPSMWCDKELSAAQFKARLSADSDAKLKIGPGEVVTVRVPTHEEGSCIVWEFATDHYDIGFGVYFEWTISPSDRVTVHISESSDEEDDEDNHEDSGGADAAAEEGEQVTAGDGPNGSSKRRRNEDDKAVDEIIPVFRRDCHEEVYCGSHQYPGRGVYLLKFDNSYSLWRSKWLYYRVYYTK